MYFGIFLLFLYISSSFANNNLQEARDDYLPNYHTPLEYDISIITYLDTGDEKQFTFEGYETILFLINEASTIITLHNEVSIIEEPVITNLNDTNEIVDIRSYTMQDRKLFIYLPTQLVINNTYQLDIKFKSNISENYFGLYKNTYLEDGITKYMAATFFECPGARLVFPCWDEPKWKANFTLHIGHKSDHIVLANMPKSGPDTLITEKPELINWYWSHFETTPKMSTYLVGFTVSEFKESVTVDGIHVGWARPNAAHQAKYASEIGPKAEKYLEEFVAFTDPMPKNDHIALPDFVAGAMENWGLIIYRETALLYENNVSSTANKQRIATVVTHELAHQFFGNIISPKLWDYIWLNEGFATYFEYHALHAIEPDWGLDQVFYIDEMYAALISDSYEFTHPIVDVVEDPSGDEIFDGLAYTKGGPMVKFISKIMQDENFKYGIQNYMYTFQYGNANLLDLWNSLQPFVINGTLPDDNNLSDILTPWFKQSGYPIITILRDYEAKSANITQERYVMYNTTTWNEKWWIPLTMASQFDTEFNNFAIIAWHDGTDLNLQLNSIAEDQWIIFNVQQIGFYRVNYDIQNWRMLITALNNEIIRNEIHIANRAQLIDDSLNLARVSRLDYSTAFDLSKYLKYEIDYLPWASALNAFPFIYDRLNYETDSRSFIEYYLLNNIKTVYDYVGGVYPGNDTETHLHKVLRMLILKKSCEYGYKVCLDDCINLYTQWTNEIYPDKINPIHPDLRYVVYCSAMRLGNMDDLNFFIERYKGSNDIASEQDILLQSMTCSFNNDVIQRLLFASIGDDQELIIRPLERKNIFSWLTNNRMGVNPALEFLVAYYNEAITMYGGQGTVGDLFVKLAEKLNTQEQKQKMVDLKNRLNSNEYSTLISKLDRALLKTDHNLEWNKDHKSNVIQYFNVYKNAATKLNSIANTLLLLIFTRLIAFLLLN